MAVNTIDSSELSGNAQAVRSQNVVLEPATPRVSWMLHAYQKEGDALVDEWPLPGLSLGVMHNLFQQPQDDPMYDGYLVEEAQAGRLQAYTDHAIDLQAYDYFVECYAE